MAQMLNSRTWEFEEMMLDTSYSSMEEIQVYLSVVLLHSSLGNLWDVHTKESSDILLFSKRTLARYLSHPFLLFGVPSVGLHF